MVHPSHYFPWFSGLENNSHLCHPPGTISCCTNAKAEAVLLYLSQHTLDMHWRLIMQKGEAGFPCRSPTWLDTQTWRSQVGSPKLTLEPYKWDQSCWETRRVLGLILAKGEEGRNLGSLEPSLAQITITSDEIHSCFHCSEHGGGRPAASEAGLWCEELF